MEDYIMSITVNVGLFKYKNGRKVQVRQFTEEGAVDTEDGVINAKKDDYLIIPSNGNMFPLTPDAFAATFERCAEVLSKRSHV